MSIWMVFRRSVALPRSTRQITLPTSSSLSPVATMETVYGTVVNIHGGVAEHLMGAASGVTWMTLVFFVSMVVVSAGLMVWQLYARRGESLDSYQEHGLRAADAPLRRVF